MSDEHFDEKIVCQNLKFAVLLYSQQVADKRNASDIICAICQSLIFRKFAANYAAERPIELPLPFQKKSSNEQFEQEMVSNWWFVNNMYEFENIGYVNI